MAHWCRRPQGPNMTILKRKLAGSAGAFCIFPALCTALFPVRRKSTTVEDVSPLQMRYHETPARLPPRPTAHLPPDAPGLRPVQRALPPPQRNLPVAEQGCQHTATRPELQLLHAGARRQLWCGGGGRARGAGPIRVCYFFWTGQGVRTHPLPLGGGGGLGVCQLWGREKVFGTSHRKRRKNPPGVPTRPPTRRVTRLDTPTYPPASYLKFKKLSGAISPASNCPPST